MTPEQRNTIESKLSDFWDVCEAETLYRRGILINGVDIDVGKKGDEIIAYVDSLLATKDAEIAALKAQLTAPAPLDWQALEQEHNTHG